MHANVSSKSRIPRPTRDGETMLQRSNSLRLFREPLNKPADRRCSGDFREDYSSNGFPFGSSRHTINRRALGSSCTELTSLTSTPQLHSVDNEDCESVKSCVSGCSSFSLDAYLTGRNHRHSQCSKRNVLHCQTKHETVEEYLTPTQRQTREIRRLKALLMKTQKELDNKNSEVSDLSKQMKNIQLDKHDSSQNVSLAPYDKMDMSATSSKSNDSGHFDQADFINGISKEDERHNGTVNCDTQTPLARKGVNNGHDEPNDDYYLSQIEEVKRCHAAEYQEMKEKYNDKIESLLQKLNEANSRYYDMRPQLDRAQDRIRKLETEVRLLEEERNDQDERHYQMYLKMYKKGQEAARFEHADEVMEFASHAPNRVNVPELLQQLHLTQNELERLKNMYRREIYKKPDSIKDSDVTLRFLRDAVYYFLTDKDNRGHLQAIESILGFSDIERVNIERALLVKKHLK